MSDKTVHVDGISCEHCVRTIEREVSGLAGVTSVKADLETRRVEVEWDDAVTEWAAIRDLMREIHYPPSDAG